MKYVKPYGIEDPDAHYINGDPSIARMGSIPPAEAFEHPMRELVALIDYSVITPDEEDLEQVAKGVRSQRMNYCEDTGSVNTLSVALDPPLEEYTIGLPLHVKITNTNTGPVTIDAGAGRVPVRKPNGAELAASDLPANCVAGLIYDGTVFQMVNFGGAGGGGDTEVFQINIPYTVDTGTVNTVIANFSAGAGITTYTAGLIFMVKITNTNNTFTNINVNGLGLRPVYAQGGHPNWPLLPGDLQAGDVLVFVYDGSVFWIYANTTINQNITFNISTVAQFDQIFVALGRKRISTSGSVRLLLAIGVYGPTPGSLQERTILCTYHADADRITIEGTMNAGQTPPRTANFQRTGSGAPGRAADASWNLNNMLRIRYGTEIRMDTTTWRGISHLGPGRITFKNLLVVGPNVLSSGQRGFSASGSAMRIIECSVWGSGDTGYVADQLGHIITQNCHACASSANGFSATGKGGIALYGGGAYGNAVIGLEASHGGTIGADGTERLTGGSGTQANGTQSSCNGSTGTSAQSGTILMTHATIVSNGVFDMNASYAGISGRYLSSVGTMSPAENTIGNFNALSINYG
jgi:hypothetical protein